jgi:Flp pilus assembly secretin CpaC
LFRSKQFRDRQTELVVFVTPRFVGGAPMPADAASIGVSPLREPTRLLPSMTPRSESSGWGGNRVEAGPIDPVAPVAPVVVPTEAAAAPAVPAVHTPEGSQPAPSAAMREAAGEDRGTASRYRAGRERLRMVD